MVKENTVRKLEVRNCIINFRMERWANKTAVVTGASAGIGAAICLGLANAGLSVVGLARRPELIDKLKEDVTGTGRIQSRKCDVSETDEIRLSFEWVVDNFGGVDVLVNNAGALFNSGNMTDIGDNKISDKDLLATIDVNLKAVVMCTRYAVASMKKRKFDGYVININSIAGHYIPFRSGFNIYPSTKHAVSAFTSSLLNELADCKSKIKVTSLSPGLVNTKMTQHHSTAEEVPILQPSDIADAVLYLLSTPPYVNITELTVMSVAEKKL
ncbi:unnamed protein product, partial [Iphiclides podalirius]